MFYEFDRHFDIADYDKNGLLRLDSILKIFQEAAIYHSGSIGYTTESYMGSGNIWMHNKNLFKTEKLPNFKQKLKVKTWSRGIDKFKGYRNYEIYADGEKCITGSSIWIYLNIEKRRPIRPTADMLERYDSEDVPVMNDMIKELSFREPSENAKKVSLTLRPSDYDVNGHVSNVTYGQFLDTALSGLGYELQGAYVSLSYMNEIKPDISCVDIRAEKVGDIFIIGVYSEGVCNCLGEVWNE